MKNYLQIFLLIFIIFITPLFEARAQWVQTNGPEGGKVHSFAGCDSVLFAGTLGGGVFFTSNEGKSWSLLAAGLINKGVTSLALDSSGLFVGTGSGLFQARNAGKEWTVTNAGLSNSSIYAVVSGRTGLFAATNAGVSRSTDAGASWNTSSNGLPSNFLTCMAVSPDYAGKLIVGTQTNGVFVSTDSGETWSASNIGLTSKFVHALVFDRDSLNSDTTRLYAGTDLGVFISTNNGSSWTATNLGNVGVLSLAAGCSKSGGKYLVAGTYLEDGGLFLSTDKGTSWTPLGSLLPSYNDVPSLYIGKDSSAHIYAGLSGAGVFLSTDNGASWKAANTGLIGSSIYSIAAIDNGAGGTNVFTGSDYVPFVSLDNGTTWNTLSIGNPLFGRTQCFAASKGRVYAGTAMGVFVSTDLGTDWPSTPTLSNNSITSLLSIADSPDRLFAGTNTGNIYMSTDNGGSWNSAGMANNNILSLASVKASAGVTTLFAGTSSGVARSTDFGTTWSQSGLANTSIRSFAATPKGIFAATDNGVFFSADTGKDWAAVDSGRISTIVHSLAASGLNVFATTDSSIFFYMPASQNWKSINEGLFNTSAATIAVSPTDLFVGTAGSGVWKRSFANLGIFTESARLRYPRNDSTLTIEPASFSWNSLPGAKTYQLQIGFDTAFANVYLDVSSFADTSLRVGPLHQDTASYWRVRACSENDTSGWSPFWKFTVGTITSAAEESTTPTTFAVFQNYPNPFNPATTIRYQLPTAGHVTLKVYDLLGREVRTLVSDNKKAGQYEVEFNGNNLPSGVYFYRLQTERYTDTKKLLLLK
jgi:photosystem II stability/assembly factor-like uncharacterized protein